MGGAEKTWQAVNALLMGEQGGKKRGLSHRTGLRKEKDSSLLFTSLKEREGKGHVEHHVGGDGAALVMERRVWKKNYYSRTGKPGFVTPNQWGAGMR